MSFITTHSGLSVHMASPTPQMIDPSDIGRSLSRICRFGGHTRQHYSVAQHCVLASQFVPVEHQLTALMHDATEAYVGDMVSPLKAMIPAFKGVEDRFWTAIATRFGLPSAMDPCIKNIDLILLATERRDLLCEGEAWDCLEGVVPLPIHIQPWPMDHAYQQWMARFNELSSRRQADMAARRMAS
ncbi:phosphohydrolase [Salinicola peritrichatus]|uniref:phosphohydrolase n=1 Tax=Salinicola peritrichatus TaxID=1267424 RepID=UPI000DA24899|nr:phosphohydrolase [Salinicola peritrichatus]